jgi:hypothetical protein
MPDLTKDFLKSWARHTLDLATAQAPARNELTSEAAAMQQLQQIAQNELSTDAKRREIALRLALAEYQVSYEHL